MRRQPFPTFRREMVERFDAQIREAREHSEVPSSRGEAVPHRCEECDGLWEWLQGMRGGPIEAAVVNWMLTWFLLSPKAMAHVLGACLLCRLHADSYDWESNLEDVLCYRRPRHEQQYAELYRVLTPRQRWCLLKMLIWSYLEEPQADRFEAAQRLRLAMGFHEDWPRPRTRPQT